MGIKGRILDKWRDTLSSEREPRLLYMPDYACIGFPKCATTFILRRFEEYGFDTLTGKEFQIRKLRSFQSEIKAIQGQGGKVAIKSPVIVYRKKDVDFLLRSGCKVIVSVRNPVRWLKSFYNYRLRRIEKGLETLGKFQRAPSFQEIINNNIDFKGVSVERGKMFKIISQNILSSQYVDENQVFFVIQEEFESQHDKVQAELLDFMQIPDSERNDTRYKFAYDKPDRWSSFNDDGFDDQLYEIYEEEIRSLCQLMSQQTGKNMKELWEEFYSIRIS